MAARRSFTLGERRQITNIAKDRPADYDLPFSMRSLSKLGSS
jgi:hypothetical protein